MAAAEDAKSEKDYKDAIEGFQKVVVIVIFERSCP